MATEKLPKIRTGLNVTELGSELIVFDSATSNAHCLDKVGGAVFLACRDGDSLESLEEKLGADYSEEAIQIALAQLEELSLLENSSEGVTRRQALEAMGVAVLGVVVASVAAPSPVAAQSCVRCRLDPVTKLPCDCSTCGQPCSLATSSDPCGTGRVKGPCSPIENSVCCFEYIRSGATPPAGQPQCFNERLGDYGCRDVADGFSFKLNCMDARVSSPTNRYYCCCCSPTGPLNRNCPTFC